MYLIGDIGNTHIKICLFNSKLKLVNKIRFSTNSLNNNYLNKKLIFLKKYRFQMNKILFSSVVPNAFKTIKKFFKKKFKINCIELKNCNLSNLIKIKVNKRQIGSDRLANAISVIDNKNNYIIVDFGTATNFDVVINNQYIGGILAPGLELSLNNLIEKPKIENSPSNLSIIGRYILNIKIFELIEKQSPGALGEIQITDAIKNCIEYDSLYGKLLEGKHFDAGNPNGMLEASLFISKKNSSNSF